MHRTRRLTLLSLIFALLLAACGGASAARGGRTAVRIQLNWTHGTEFAGYYQAIEQGYYAARGLDVQLTEGGLGEQGYVDPAAPLLSGEAPFAVLTFAEYAGILGREPRPLVVMGLFQISPVVLFSLEESGIVTLQDMRGKRVAIISQPWQQVIHRALRNAGMTPEDIREVRLQNPDMESFFKQRVDVWSGYLIDEVVAAQLEGYRLNLIFPADYDANTYEGLLVTTQAYASAHPDIVTKVVEATLQGWRYALEHPRATAEVLQSWNPQHPRLYYELGLDYLRPLVDTGEVPLGWIDYARWRAAFENALPADSPGYDMRFVEGAHIQE